MKITVMYIINYIGIEEYVRRCAGSENNNKETDIVEVL
jgi:hypothetical protein